MSCNVFYPDEESKLLGVVLVNSGRNGLNDILSIKGKLEQLNIPVVVSIQKDDKEYYADHFLPNEIFIALESVEWPLAGLLSVHTQFTESDILVVNENFQNEDVDLVKLIDTYQEKAGEHDFLVCQKESTLTSGVGIYTAEGLSKIVSLLSAGLLENQQLTHILEIGNTLGLEINN